MKWDGCNYDTPTPHSYLLKGACWHNISKHDKILMAPYGLVPHSAPNNAKTKSSQNGLRGYPAILPHESKTIHSELSRASQVPSGSNKCLSIFEFKGPIYALHPLKEEKIIFVCRRSAGGSSRESVHCGSEEGKSLSEPG